MIRRTDFFKVLHNLGVIIKMRKHILFITLVILIMNCGIMAWADSSSELSECISYEIEPNRSNLPGYYEASKLKAGMTLAEAVDIMGNPQGTYSGISCLIYNLQNGQTLKLYYYMDENREQYVCDIKITGWPYRLITAIFAAAAIILAVVIASVKSQKHKMHSEFDKKRII